MGNGNSRTRTAETRGRRRVTLRARNAEEGMTRRLGTDLHGSRRRQDKRLPDIAGLIDPDQFELITKPTSGFVVIEALRAREKRPSRFIESPI